MSVHAGLTSVLLLAVAAGLQKTGDCLHKLVQFCTRRVQFCTNCVYTFKRSYLHQICALTSSPLLGLGCCRPPDDRWLFAHIPLCTRSFFAYLNWIIFCIFELDHVHICTKLCTHYFTFAPGLHIFHSVALICTQFCFAHLY